MDGLTEDILEAAAGGDRAAFETLYRQSAGFVYNVALNITASPDLAEDVTQNVFIKLFDKLKGFEGRSAFKTWLYRVTVNMALNARRGRAKHEAVDIETVADTLPDTGTPEDEAVRASENERHWKLLEILSPEQRTSVVLRNVEGMSYREIARAMNVNVNTVRTWLRRARMKLLECAGKEVASHEV